MFGLQQAEIHGGSCRFRLLHILCFLKDLWGNMKKIREKFHWELWLLIKNVRGVVGTL